MMEGAKKKIHTHFGKVGMPKGKIRHAKRVEQRVKKMFGRTNAKKDAQLAALFHDYIERGGDINTAKRKFKLSDKVTNIIGHLSDPEKMNVGDIANNAPLAHMRMILEDPSILPEEKQIVILVKIADRLDNLTRRISWAKRGLPEDALVNIGKYRRASAELLDYLFNFYFMNYGKDNSIKKAFNQYRDVDAQLKEKKRMGLAKPWKQQSQEQPQPPQQPEPPEY